MTVLIVYVVLWCHYCRRYIYRELLSGSWFVCGWDHMAYKCFLCWVRTRIGHRAVPLKGSWHSEILRWLWGMMQLQRDVLVIKWLPWTQEDDNWWTTVVCHCMMCILCVKVVHYMLYVKYWVVPLPCLPFRSGGRQQHGIDLSPMLMKVLACGIANACVHGKGKWFWHKTEKCGRHL